MSALSTRALVAALSLFIQISASAAEAATAKTDGIADYLNTVVQEWYVPHAAEFARDSGALKQALGTLCEATPEKTDNALQSTRKAWINALLSWERLATVATGPLIERHSQRQIDFTPTRPRLIEKGIQSAPASLKDLELIGTPAKGLPTLEWLLWVKLLKPASSECRYASLLAEEIEHEARTLEAAYNKTAGQRLSTEAANVALNELVNQWVGGLERLRWSNMEMPVRVAMTSKSRIDPDYPRGASGATAKSWMAQWQALRALAIGQAYSLDALSRQTGHDRIANQLAAAVHNADRAMQRARTGGDTGVFAATQALAGLKRVVEDKVAPALGVVIGFSDADGD